MISHSIVSRLMLLIFLCISMIATSISQADEPEEPIPIDTLIPTETETLIPTDTATLTPTETETLIPTDTATSTPTDTPTLIPTIDIPSPTDDAPFLCYAQSVVRYTPGTTKEGEIDLQYLLPERALGIPEHDAPLNFVALGFGGEIILSFAPYVVLNQLAEDFSLAISNNGQADVLVSADGVTWYGVGTADATTAIDLGVVGWFQYIHIIDTSDPDDFTVEDIPGVALAGVRAFACSLITADLPLLPTLTPTLTETGIVDSPPTEPSIEISTATPTDMLFPETPTATPTQDVIVETFTPTVTPTHAMYPPVAPLSVCFVRHWGDEQSTEWLITNPNSSPLSTNPLIEIGYDWQVLDSAGEFIQEAQGWDNLNPNTAYAHSMWLTWYLVIDGQATAILGETIVNATAADSCDGFEPTMTPTPSAVEDLPAMQPFNILSTGCTLPETTLWVVVATVEALREAVTCANEWNRNTPFEIYLAEDAPIFMLTSTLQIQSQIEIYGRGIEESILDGSGFYRLFSVFSGSLMLSHVTLQNARPSVTYGGALWAGGTASIDIRDSRLRNNRATSGGGAIMASGNIPLNLERTQFISNYAGGGAAIQTSSVMNLDCILFQGNSNNNYAAAMLIHASGNVTIGQSAFMNTTTNEISVRDQSSLDASENYWQHPSASQRVRSYENGTFDISNPLSTNPFDGSECDSPPPRAIPEDELTLADFGIQLQYDGDFWDAVQQQEIENVLEGVHLIAEALEILGVPGNTPQERFRSIFISSQQGGSDLTITFLRLPPSDQPIPGDTPYTFYYNRLSVNCLMYDAEDNTPETATGYVIACRGFQSSPSWNPGGIPSYGILTVEAIIHELGHVIDARTGTNLRQQITARNLVDCRLDGLNNPVMAFANPLGVSNPRGLEGWGSLSMGPNDISQFQQNPTASAEETTADMFLNWVYRITSSSHSYFNPGLVLAGGQDYLCGYMQPNQNEGHIPRINDGSGRIQLAHDPARTEWENINWLGFLNINGNGYFASTDYPDGTRREHLPGNARYTRFHNTLANLLLGN